MIENAIKMTAGYPVNKLENSLRFCLANCYKLIRDIATFVFPNIFAGYFSELKQYFTNTRLTGIIVPALVHSCAKKMHVITSTSGPAVSRHRRGARPQGGAAASRPGARLRDT